MFLQEAIAEARKELAEEGFRSEWKPAMEADRRESMYALRKKAVSRSFDWLEE